MKISKNKIKSIVFLLAVSFVFSSCQKEEINSQKIPDSHLQLSEDGNEQNEITDEVVDIVMHSFESSGNMRKLENNDDLCNMNVQQYTAKKFIFTFSGDNCAGTKIRKGSIVCLQTSDVKWHEKGGAIELTFDDFMVTRKSDNKTITINGKYSAYNKSGIANPFVHTLHGALKLKFDNEAERDWLINRKRTITLDGATVQVKIESDSLNFVTEVGTDRNGKQFITTIPNPIVVQNCGAGNNGYKFIKGEIVYTLAEKSLSVNVGYTSLSQKVENCEATGSVLTYTDASTLIRKFYPYNQ